MDPRETGTILKKKNDVLYSLGDESKGTEPGWAEVGWSTRYTQIFFSSRTYFEQKLLPLTLSQRKRFKSDEIIIVVINEITKRSVYMTEKGHVNGPNFEFFFILFIDKSRLG